MNPEESKTLRALISEFRRREQVGLAKYGTTVDREDLTPEQWLTHATEEGMDQLLYLLRLRGGIVEMRERIAYLEFYCQNLESIVDKLAANASAISDNAADWKLARGTKP